MNLEIKTIALHTTFEAEKDKAKIILIERSQFLEKMVKDKKLAEVKKKNKIHEEKNKILELLGQKLKE